MKIVVLDGYTENPGDLSWAPLEALGELMVYDRTDVLNEACIAARIGDADVAVTNKVPISKAVIDACRNLKFIAVLATGYNIVDCAEARRHGISVSNVPSYGTNAVAQFAIGLLLEICGHIGYHSDTVHAGRWSKSPDWCYWDMPLIELTGKTMGIIGYGRIGRQTGRIAAALGMDVIAYDSQPGNGPEFVSLDELFSRSDVIALHCPLFPQTKGIINRQSIAKMKTGVIILNNSRGPLIVEQDLADALNSGKVYAAGLDVVDEEPIAANNPLLSARNCIITPHISWAPVECRRRILECTVENIRAFVQGHPQNVVNN
ncbi:D-2-hydroxyacid dehydrogenase [uncultured Ruthenibacterium sp.]|uniref:D-2-hydroxyacid dehydrogenase n=1 Tax=uncultured Ruthenibacterium sp. TaxID=1905347 RepID=UPI00349EBC34